MKKRKYKQRYHRSSGWVMPHYQSYNFTPMDLTDKHILVRGKLANVLEVRDNKVGIEFQDGKKEWIDIIDIEGVINKNPKNYGSKLFREQIEKRLDLRAPSKEKKRLLRLYEKNPELVKPSEGVIISIGPPTKTSAFYTPEGYKIIGIKPATFYSHKKKIVLSKSLFGPSRVKVQKRKGRETVYPRWDTGPQGVLKHELMHKKQQEEGRLIRPTYFKKSGKLIRVKYETDPLEQEAILAGKKPPQRKLAQLSEFKQKGEEAFRQIFKSYGSFRVKKKGKIIIVEHPNVILSLAKQLKKQFQPLTNKIELAGSIRRKKPARDIDIVMVPKDKAAIAKKIKQLGRVISEGDKKIESKIKGVKVDIFFAEPKTYESILMFSTGPSGANIFNRKFAKEKGLLLNQYGLFNKKTGKKIASTERSIYKALGKTYRPPELRGEPR